MSEAPLKQGMTAGELIGLFEETGAVLRGHFVLSSGLHSDTYVQCALVLQYPDKAERLGRALAAQFEGVLPNCVVSPALGGVVIGHEVARALGVRAIFVERDASGRLTLRRGFSVAPEERVVVVEDVWTTGGSTQATIGVIADAGGRVVAAGALLDRSGGRLNLSVPAEALLVLPIANYEPDNCPLCRAGSEAVRPGSRFLRPTL
jgi:orotate phosphoribosyltransferase